MCLDLQSLEKEEPLFLFAARCENPVCLHSHQRRGSPLPSLKRSWCVLTEDTLVLGWSADIASSAGTFLSLPITERQHIPVCHGWTSGLFAAEVRFASVPREVSLVRYIIFDQPLPIAGHCSLSGLVKEACLPLFLLSLLLSFFPSPLPPFFFLPSFFPPCFQGRL